MLDFIADKLRAALTHAADKDVRGCLNSIHVECTSSGDIHVVATDVHRAFVGRISPTAALWTDAPKVGPWTITIPRATAAQALKNRTQHVRLCALPDGRYTLADQVFVPIDQRYPDWRRIVPPAAAEYVHADYNWDYARDAQLALRLWCGNKHALVRLHSRGESGGLATCEADDAFVVIMPARLTSKSKPIADRFTPVPL